MRKAKIIIQGDGIATCLGQWEAINKIKDLNATTWVEKAFKGNGYLGFNMETGEIEEKPGPTTIKLYEIPKNKELSLPDLRNHFWQNWQRLNIEIEERVKSFFIQNCEIT